MKYFFSGVDTLTPALREQIVPQCPWRLLSVHDEFLKTAHDWMGYMPLAPGAEAEIMLDSGAFTAWSKGRRSTYDGVRRAYADLIAKFGSRTTAFWLINLDSIPGAKGASAPGEAEMAQALRESDENYAKLQAEFGLRVLPVYHQFEAAARLDEVLLQNPDYVCISPRNDFPEGQRISFVRSVHMAMAAKQSTTRTHLLGATGVRMLTSVPVHSADSISWQLSAGLGSVLWYDGEVLHNITMSERDTAEGGALGNTHWRIIHSSLRDSVAATAAEYGLTVDDLREKHSARAAFNMLSIIGMVRALQHVVMADQDDMFNGIPKAAAQSPAPIVVVPEPEPLPQPSDPQLAAAADMKPVPSPQKGLFD